MPAVVTTRISESDHISKGEENSSSNHEQTTNAPGASARREFERRQAKREQAVRAKHPKLGGFLLAISDEPQSTKAWDKGARGEEILGRRLDRLTTSIVVLHDRGIPRTRANIDHILVTSNGVWVVDAKRYRDQRPSLKIEGGILRARTEKLLVGGRDRTKLVDGAIKQRDLVGAALSRSGISMEVHASLCFVEADWPLFGGSFTIRDVLVTWPQNLEKSLLAKGPISQDEQVRIAETIVQTFPPA